jgi:hypothetical protein
MGDESKEKVQRNFSFCFSLIRSKDQRKEKNEDLLTTREEHNKKRKMSPGSKHEHLILANSKTRSKITFTDMFKARNTRTPRAKQKNSASASPPKSYSQVPTVASRMIYRNASREPTAPKPQIRERSKVALARTRKPPMKIAAQSNKK